MFRLIAIDFSLLSPTSPCELSEREVTSPSNLKVVDNYSLVFSLPDPKGHVSYCHHLASVVVVRRTS
jgi:hypothetical protein